MLLIQQTCCVIMCDVCGCMTGWHVTVVVAVMMIAGYVDNVGSKLVMMSCMSVRGVIMCMVMCCCGLLAMLLVMQFMWLLLIVLTRLLIVTGCGYAIGNVMNEHNVTDDVVVDIDDVDVVVGDDVDDADVHVCVVCGVVVTVDVVNVVEMVDDDDDVVVVDSYYYYD